MPKVTLQFNLPEEQNEFDNAINAGNMKSVLWNFAQQLRSWRKYYHDFQDASDALDKIREEFHSLLNDHNVNID
jgi:hypothetical protein